jgi:hypothetical protein
VAAAPELLGPQFWQPAVPQAAVPLSPFASLHGGDPLWEQAQHGVNPAVLEYGHYSTLGVHTGMLPQTVFGPGETLHSPLGLAPLPDRDGIGSRLFAPADLLQGMLLDDGPSSPPAWHVPSAAAAVYEGPRCVELSEPDVASSTWADDTPDEQTISPKMLRLQHSPSPSSSCDSLRASFLDLDSSQSPEGLPCRSAIHTHTPAAPSPRRLLPTMSSTMSSRPSTASSEPASPQRRLSRLRPKAEPAAPTSSPSPPPSTSTSRQPPSPRSSSGAADRRPTDLETRLARDEFLVRQRQAGMTYKEIRRAGGFTEAESTLRGRYRTLTKSREARVRKPEWGDKDVSCPLCRPVI